MQQKAASSLPWSTGDITTKMTSLIGPLVDRHTLDNIFHNP